MQGMTAAARIASAAASMFFICSSVSGTKSCMKDVLSSICARLLMPESTISTLGSEAQKRTAQEAMDASGSIPCRIFRAAGGTSASVPPLTPSMTITGLPCFSAVS